MVLCHSIHRFADGAGYALRFAIIKEHNLPLTIAHLANVICHINPVLRLNLVSFRLTCVVRFPASVIAYLTISSPSFSDSIVICSVRRWDRILGGKLRCLPFRLPSHTGLVKQDARGGEEVRPIRPPGGSMVELGSIRNRCKEVGMTRLAVAAAALALMVVPNPSSADDYIIFTANQGFLSRR